MKKIFSFMVLSLLFMSGIANSMENTFPEALKTCQKYSKTQDLVRYGSVFTLSITLENKANGCVYKEKISQGQDYNLMTCTFPKNTLSVLSDLMSEYNKQYKTQIAKENIFEAKMTNNYTIMEKYLANPKYCKITANRANQIQ